MPGPTVRNTPHGLVRTRNRGRVIRPEARRPIVPISSSSGHAAVQTASHAPAPKAPKVVFGLPKLDKFGSKSPLSVIGPQGIFDTSTTRKHAMEDIKASSKVDRIRDARDYLQDMSPTLEQHLTKGPDGKLKLKLIDPVNQNHMDQYNKAAKAIMMQLNDATARGVKPEEIDKLARHVFSRLSFQHDWHELHHAAKLIRRGQMTYTSPRHEPLSRIGHLLKGADAVAHVPGDVMKFISTPTASEQIQEQGIADLPVMGAVMQARRKASQATLRGAGAFAQVLTRPGYAIETAIAKDLVKAGAIKGATAEKIKKAPNATDVLAHGMKKGGVSGSDITQGIFGEKHGGLAVDFLTDPLMYIGIGGLTETAGRSLLRAGVIEQRLVRSGIDTAGEVSRITEQMKHTGDYSTLEKELSALASKNRVSTRLLGKRPGEHALMQDLQGKLSLRHRIATRHPTAFPKTADKARELFPRLDKAQTMLHQDAILRSIREGINSSPRIRGKTVHVPSDAGIEALSQSIRRSIGTKLRPGFRIRIMSPTGHEFGHIPIPLPSILADTPIIPRLRSFGGRETVMPIKLQKEFEHADLRHVPRIEDAFNRLQIAKVEGDAAEIESLTRELADRQTKFSQELHTIRSKAASKYSGTFEFLTPRQVTELSSRRRIAHAAVRGATGMADSDKLTFMGMIADALKPIMGDINALKRVSLQHFSDTEVSKNFLQRAGLPALSDKEAQALVDLRKAYDSMARFGVERGTLNSFLEGYLPRVWHKGELAQVRELESLKSAKPGAPSDFYTRGRRTPALVDLADPEVMRHEISDAFNVPYEQASQVLDKWFTNSKFRVATEQLARGVQRGAIKNIDDLTPFQKRAYEWSQRWPTVGGEAPIFEDVAKTEGVLKIHPGAEEAHGLLQDPFENLGLTANEEALAKTHSAITDRSRIETLLQGADDRLRPQLEEIAQSLDREIGQYAPVKSFPGEGPGEAYLKKAQLLNAEPPLPGLRKINPERTDPWDVTQRLPDLRKDAAYEGLAPILDPFEAAFYRVKAERRVSAQNALVRATNEIYGKTTADTVGEFFDKTTGKPLGHVNELRVNVPTMGQFENAPETLWHGSFSDTPMRPGEPVHIGTIEAATQRINRLSRMAEAGDPKIAAQVHEHMQELRIPHPDQAGLENADAIPVQIRDDARIYDLTIDPDGLRQKHGLEDTGTSVTSDEATSLPALTQELKDQGYDGAKYTNHHEDVNSISYVIFDPQKSLNRYSDLMDSAPFKHQITGVEYARDSIHFGEQRLMPIRTRPDGSPSRYMDIHTGEEYGYPQFMADEAGSDPIGKAIDKTLPPGTLWPATVIDDVKAELLRQGEIGMQRGYQSLSDSLFQRVMASYRFGVTELFPAFHIRNLVTDVLKSLQADTGVVFHPIANAHLLAIAGAPEKMGQKIIRIPGMPDMTTEEFLLMGDTFNLRTNQQIAEFTQLAQTGAHIRTKGRGIVGALGPKGAIGKHILHLGAKRENIVRFTTFRQRLLRNGGDFADASWYMIKHHFDYGDLSNFERRTMRNLFLFYTWYRKNIPLQFLELISRPGFFAALGETYHASAEGTAPWSQDWSKIAPFLPDMSGKVAVPATVPDYMFQSLGAIYTNWNGHAAAIGFGAPWNDMNLVTNFFEKGTQGEALRNVAQMTNPIFGVAYQLLSGKDILSGRTFGSNEAGGIAEALSLIPGVNLQKNDQGEPTVPWWISVLGRGLPAFGRGSSALSTPSSFSRDTGWISRHGPLFGALSGTNVYVAPGLYRAQAAWLRIRAAERTDLLAGLGRSHISSNDKYFKDKVAEFDRETLRQARKRKVSRKRLRGASGLSIDQHHSTPDTPGLGLDKTPGSPTPFKGKSGATIPGLKVSTYLPGGSGSSGSTAATTSTEAPSILSSIIGLFTGNAPPAPKQATAPKAAKQAAVKLSAKFADAGIDHPDKVHALAHAAAKLDIPVEILAAIGKIESTNGTLKAPGVKLGTNSSGAAGPFQFLQSTWEPIAQELWGKNASKHSVYNYADAALGAAKYLKNTGLTHDPSTYHNAIFAYNHADWYVDEVLTAADSLKDKAWSKVGQAPGGGAVVARVPAGRFAHPFPGKYWSESRTDQGKDFAPKTPNAPILAVADSTYVGKGQGPSWEGGGGGGNGDGIVLKLDNAKGLPAQYVWIYEGVLSDQNLKVGQHIKKGQVIGKAAGSGSSIEMGWSTSAEGHVMTPYNGAPDGTAMPAGIAMANFLDGIKRGGNIKIPSLANISFASVGSGSSSGGSSTGGTSSGKGSGAFATVSGKIGAGGLTGASSLTLHNSTLSGPRTTRDVGFRYNLDNLTIPFPTRAAKATYRIPKIR
jgi:murein DD-endopeptidase MepM/ murein hydrolase activator NlpD